MKFGSIVSGGALFQEFSGKKWKSSFVVLEIGGIMIRYVDWICLVSELQNRSPVVWKLDDDCTVIPNMSLRLR